MEAIRQFNRVFKEMDDLYRHAAKASGLSECAFWILYFLCENGAPLTQRKLNEMLLQPKQSINTQLKKMELDGWVVLAPAPDDRRSRLVSLTEEGQRIAARTASPILEAEKSAFRRFCADELESYLLLLQKHKNLLASTFADFLKGDPS